MGVVVLWEKEDHEHWLGEEYRSYLEQLYDCLVVLPDEVEVKNQAVMWVPSVSR